MKDLSAGAGKKFIDPQPAGPAAVKGDTLAGSPYDLFVGLRWCSKCKAMYVTHMSETMTACPAGGQHELEQSWSYWSPTFNSSYTEPTPYVFKSGNMASFPGQRAWFRCTKCQALHLPEGDGGPGACAGGGTHAADRGMEIILGLENQGEQGQSGWRWCRKCAGMFHNNAQAGGSCPGGGQHSVTGSGAYIMRHLLPTPTLQGPLICVHRGYKDDQLYFCRGELDEAGVLHWSGDVPLPWNSYSGASLAWHSGKLFLVFAGSDKRLYWAIWSKQNQTFGDLQVFQDHYSEGTPALLDFGGTLWCVHMGRGEHGLSPDSDLYYTVFNDSTNSWGTDTRFGGEGNKTGAGPSLIQVGSTMYCVFRKTSGFAAQFLMSNSWDGSSWGDACQISNDSVSPQSYSRPAVINHLGNIYCVYRGKNSDSHIYSIALSTAGGYSGYHSHFNPASGEVQGTNLAADGPGLIEINQKLWCIHRGDDPGFWYSVFDETKKTFLPDYKVEGTQIRYEPALAKGLLSL